MRNFPAFRSAPTTVKFGTFPTDILECPQNVPKNWGKSPTSKLGHGEDIRTFESLFVRAAADGIIPRFLGFIISIIFCFQSLSIKQVLYQIFYCETFKSNPIPLPSRETLQVPQILKHIC